MEYIVIIVIGIVILVWRDISKNKEAEKERRLQEVARIALKVQDVLEKITYLKTNSAKINNCGKAISLLNKADEYEECHEVIKNFNELKSRLISIQNVLPVVDHIEKSYKHKFKGKAKPEQNSLLDALYEIRQKGITNQDFVEAEVFPEGTGEIVTIEGIQQRLSELGWNEN